MVCASYGLLPPLISSDRIANFGLGAPSVNVPSRGEEPVLVPEPSLTYFRNTPNPVFQNQLVVLGEDRRIQTGLHDTQV